MILWANGDFVEAETLCIPPRDRGFLLGDGVFDTFRIARGAPLYPEAHLARLRAAAAAFAIPVPFSDAEAEAAARTLSARNALAEAAGRLTLTRGAGPRGLAPPAEPQPFYLMAVAPAPAAAPASLDMLLSDVARSSTALSCRHKTLSYIDNVEARRRAETAGCGEAAMLNERGELACASAANLFWVSGGALFTPSLDCGVLAGITRARVLRAAADMNLDVREGAFPAGALEAADAAFVTNSVLGLVPAKSLKSPSGMRAFDVEHEMLTALRAALAKA